MILQQGYHAVNALWLGLKVYVTLALIEDVHVCVLLEWPLGGGVGGACCDPVLLTGLPFQKPGT